MIACCLIALILLVACAGPKRDPPEAIYERGRQELRLGNFDKAAAQADLGFRGWRSQAGSPWYWRFRLLQAEILLARGKAKEALPLLQARLPDSPEFSELVVRQRLHQGRAAFMFGEYPRAKKLLDEALHLATKIDSTPLAAETELRRACPIFRIWTVPAGEVSFRNTLEIGIRLGDLYLQAAALGNLGFGLMNHSRYDEAIPFFERALAASEKFGSRDFTARIRGNLGMCYYGLGDMDRALKLLSQAELEAARWGLRDRHVWLGDIGNVYYELRDFRKAISYYQRALALARELEESFSIAEWLNYLAEASIDAGDLTSAESYNHEALALGERTQNLNRPRSLLNAARIAAARKQFEDAERRYSDVIESASKLGNRVAVWEAQVGLANLSVATQRWQKATEQFQSAVSTIEGARSQLARDEWKLTFLDPLIRFYDEYVDFLMDRGRVAQALEVAESCRARLLAEKLGLESRSVRRATAVDFRAKARAEKAVLLSYWLAPRRSFLWAVTPDSVQSFTLPPEKEISRMWGAYTNLTKQSTHPLGTRHRNGLHLVAVPVAPAP